MKGQSLLNHGAAEGKISEEFNELFLEYFGSSAPGNSGSTGERSMNPISNDKTKKSEGKSKNNQIEILGKFSMQAEENTQIFRALEKKADKSGINLDILGEVFDRGIDAYSESYDVSPTQYAFARVNSFINKGRTYYTEDADLQQGILSFSEKNGLWDNIHAKRKRIKAGSGERMRKPGSKGAPTDQALKAAQESVEIDESNNKPYVKPHIESGSTKQSGWKASNKHGNVKYFGMDFKKSAEKHAGISEAKDEHPIVKEYNSLKKHDIKTLRGLVKQQNKVVDTSEFKTKDHAISHYLRNKHGHKKVDAAFGFNEETDLDEAEMKGKDPCWKGYEMIGTKKKRGKEVPNCVPANEARDPDANSKLRRKVQNVERDSTPETPDSDASKPTDPCSDHSKQQRIVKRTIMSEEGNSQPDPKKRLIGTDSLVKAYKKDTPGESLDESFAMAFDYQGKPSVGPTASELYMKAQGGFAHHTDVQNVMEVTEIKQQIQKMFETTILEEDKDQLELFYSQLSDMVEEAFNIITKIKASTVERDAWSEAEILKMERYIQSVNAYLHNMYEDVVSADKKGEVVAGHKVIKTDPKTRQQIVVDVPSHVRKAPTGKKIIKTGNPNDGIPG